VTTRSFLLAICAGSIMAGGALAQEAARPAVPSRGITVQAAAEGQPARIRIQSSITIIVPGFFDDPAKMIEGQEKARRSIYEIAGRECALLKATLAGECQVESVNINAGRQPMPQLGGTQITGTMTFRATAK